MDKEKPIWEHFDDLIADGHALWNGKLVAVPIKDLNNAQPGVCPICGGIATEDGCTVKGIVEEGDVGGIVICKDAWLYALFGQIMDVRPMLKETRKS